jgi:hypothetical protein
MKRPLWFWDVELPKIAGTVREHIQCLIVLVARVNQFERI